MFKLKDKLDHDINIGSRVLHSDHGSGIVRGTTVEGTLEVRFEPSRKLGDKIDHTYTDKLVKPDTVMVRVSSYTLIISEEQRLALHSLLLNNPHSARDGGPLEFWVDMLAELPKTELDAPGIQHGFCL